jgi:hypothetical protein
MKKTILLSAGLALATLGALAQDPKGAQTMVEYQAAKTPEKKPPVIPPKPSNQILGKPVVYGGYLTDLFRAEKKRPLFSLRTPIDPRKDIENVSYYPGTDKVQGVILFSIKF